MKEPLDMDFDTAAKTSERYSQDAKRPVLDEAKRPILDEFVSLQPGEQPREPAREPERDRSTEPDRPANFGSILRIPVMVQVVLGSASMPVANLMKLGRGAVIPLDHRVGEPVDVVVNGRVVARGEVVVVEDDNSRFGVSLTEIVGPAGVDAGN